MGVPKFAAWLTKKYPDMVVDSIDGDVHGLYIDLNGLIHPCCHDEEDPSVALRPDHEKLLDICLSVETLVVTTRPQQVIYIAIDGVAPRAKMNQQRARRYMSAAIPQGKPATEAGQDGNTVVRSIEKEFTTEEKVQAEAALEEVKSALEGDALYQGGAEKDSTPFDALLPNADDLLESNHVAPYMAHAKVEKMKKDPNAFDSNCLSPGTSFMEMVAEAVHNFIQSKLTAEEEESTDGDESVWKKVTVIFSDSNVPGEGEHKLIDFLRTQSCFSGFNGHGAHVLAGLDADLIFLALSLHIPKVIILRDNSRDSPLSLLKRGKKKIPAGEDSADDEEAEEEDGKSDVPVEDEDEEAVGVDETALNDGAGHSAALYRIAKNVSYQYYDIDVVGASVVSEVYQLCLAKEFALKDKSFIKDITASNGYRFYAPDSLRFSQIYSEFHPCTSSCNSKLVDDFIVLGMIMGNDFLPRTPAAFCGESVMDSIFEVYVRDVLPYGYLTAGDHDIHLTQLSRLMKGFAEVEALHFRQHCIKSNDLTPAESMLPFPSSRDEQVWRQPYYQSTSIKPDHIRDSCFSYVQGLRFVWSYYSKTSQQVSWSWQYPFFHAPFCWDMHLYLEEEAAKAGGAASLQAAVPPAALEQEAPDTVTQLLCILPPTSAKLVPSCLRETMLHPTETVLQETFAKSWLVDYSASFGKDHLATVMTPLASLSVLKALVHEKESLFTEDERRRQTNRNYHFVYQSGALSAKIQAMIEAEGQEQEKGERHTKNSEHVFRVKGVGFRLLTDSNPHHASVMSTLARTQKEGNTIDTSVIQLSTLEEVSPEAARPRTYAFNVPINNLTTLPNGLKFRAQRRRRFYGRGNTKGRANDAPQNNNQNNNNNKKGKNEETNGNDSNAPNFAHFHIALAGVVLFVSIFLAYRVVPISFATVVDLYLLPCQIVSIFLASLVCSYGLGFATQFHQNGSGLSRNTVIRIFADWQCCDCLSLNFSKNKKCYFCSFPFVESRCTTIYSGKMPPSPPLYEANHSPYLETYGIEMD